VRVLLFFNELSCSTPQRKERVDEALRAFVHLLREITRWRRDAALISEVSLKELEVAPGYYLAEWAAQPANVDLGRQIRSMRNRAPSSDELPSGLAEGVDYSWDGRTATAMRAAHLLDGILVSLLVDPVWDSSWIQASRSVLTAAPDGEPVLVGEAVDVRHAATLRHAESHRDWFKQAGLPALKHGSEIWDSCGDIFPNLRFLPRTRRQLHGLRSDWIVPAAYELRRINDAIGDWNPERTREPTWRSKVTPEAESRKRLCRFEDFDGIERIFDWHGRFTPGAGRVYFRLVPELGTAIVAHVGAKLGI
jgi:hypothetical protein